MRIPALRARTALTGMLLALAVSAAPAAGQSVTDFPVNTANGFPDGIVMGPDGNLWFGESGTNSVGRITPAGVIDRFTTPTASSGPSGIAVGPDGNLWFTESAGKIGRIETDGSPVDEFSPTTAKKVFHKEGYGSLISNLSAVSSTMGGHGGAVQV